MKSEILSTKNFFKLSLIGILLFLVGKVFILSKNTLPVWSDEFLFFMNAKAAYFNNTLKASFTLTGKGSEWLGADPHGFAYSFIHSTIAKIFGWSNLNMIVTNIALVFASVGSIWATKMNKEQKVITSLIFLGFPFTWLYSYTYMQETIHLVIGLGIGLLLFQEKPKIFFTLLLVFFGSILRPTWAFSIFALIPYASTTKGKIGYGALGISTVFLMLYLSGKLYENTPIGMFETITYLKEGRIGVALENMIYQVKNNLIAYFSFSQSLVYIIMKFLPFILLGIFSWVSFKQKEKNSIFFVISLGLMFIFLFNFYLMNDWMELRTLAPYVAMAAPLIAMQSRNIKNGLTYFTIGGFIISLFYFQPVRERNNQSAEELNAIISQNQKQTGELSNGNDILIGYYPKDYTLDLLALPVQTESGQRINYVVPYYKTKKIPCQTRVDRENKIFTFSKID